MIPLSPKTLASIWAVLSRIPFTSCHAAFPNLDIQGPDTKQRVWDSMLIQVGAEGHDAQDFQARIERLARGQPEEGSGEELVRKGEKMVSEGEEFKRKGSEEVRRKNEAMTREEREDLQQRKQQQAEENMFGAGQGGQVDYTNTRGTQGAAYPRGVPAEAEDGLPVEDKKVVVGVAEDDEMVGVVKGGSAALVG